jgi:putative tricarboxylic transport membrane protein
MPTLDSLLLGFSVALQPDVLWYAFLGCLVGTIVGVLPGIGPLSGISILLPATFGLDTTKSVVMLAGIYYGSQYGGSTTSILMRIPGEASSVMTCIDGYAMAQKGRAVHRRGRLLDRGHIRRDYAHPDRAASRRIRAALRPS